MANGNPLPDDRFTAALLNYAERIKRLEQRRPTAAGGGEASSARGHLSTPAGAGTGIEKKLWAPNFVAEVEEGATVTDDGRIVCDLPGVWKASYILRGIITVGSDGTPAGRLDCYIYTQDASAVDHDATDVHSTAVSPTGLNTWIATSAATMEVVVPEVGGMIGLSAFLSEPAGGIDGVVYDMQLGAHFVMQGALA